LKLYSYTLSLYQFESIILMFYFHAFVLSFVELWHLFSSTCISKNQFKCILKHVVFQYYAMKSKNFLLLMIDLNNIHGFNILRYNLLIIFQKYCKCLWLAYLCHVYAMDVSCETVKSIFQCLIMFMVFFFTCLMCFCDFVWWIMYVVGKFGPFF